MLFPHCSFKVLVPHGRVFAGQHVQGTLEVESPEPIPRAKQIDLIYSATAWAGYGAGNSRTVVRRVMFRAPLAVPLPDQILRAGTHRFPFTVDIPAWLPPAFSGADCGVQHQIETRVEVRWAIDPKAVLEPVLAMAPAVGEHGPLVARTPPGFHEKLVLEVTLASSVIAQDEPLSGFVALRSGHDARFDAVEITLANRATIVMAYRDARRGSGLRIRLSANELRGGAPVPFTFPPSAALVPTFRNAFIDNDVILSVKADVPWGSDPEMLLLLHMLPTGSTMRGAAGAVPVGSARLRQSAAAMAAATGLREGTTPVLIEGNVGPIFVRVLDAPRSGKIGVDTELVFPELAMGIVFRALGFLDGFRDAPLLPEPLRTKYFLQCKPAKGTPAPKEPALVAFFGELLRTLEAADELSLSDHHLRAHFTLADDDGERMSRIARFVEHRARVIADAIAGLPCPDEAAAHLATWRAVANEQNGFLVPTGPSIHRLTFGARMSDGEERALDVAICTAWTEEGPVTRVEVGLGAAPVPSEAWSDFDESSENELARTVLNAFPIVRMHQGGARLEKPGLTADPRVLFPGIDAFLAWVLATRGERKADAPYR